MTAPVGRRPPVRWRAVGLPAQHGGWGFLLVPLLLGLLLAPTAAGLLLGLGAVGLFLLHQPLRLTLKDRHKGRITPRTRLATRFAAGYGSAALVSSGIAVALAWPDLAPLLPLLAATPLAVIQIALDVRNRGRGLSAEAAGAVAPGALASSLALLGNWRADVALALWGLHAIWAVTSVLYVRARLRLERGRPTVIFPVVVAHGAGLLAGTLLAAAALLPWTAFVALGILAVRAAWGLSRWRRPVRTAVVGILEMVYGLALALLTGLGYAAM